MIQGPRGNHIISTMSNSEALGIWANRMGRVSVDPVDSLELIKIPRVNNETQGFLVDPEENPDCIDGTAWNPPILSSSDSLVWSWCFSQDSH